MNTKVSPGAGGRANGESAGEELALANILIIIALAEERLEFRDVALRRKNWTLQRDERRFACTYNSRGGPVRVAVRTLEMMGHIEAANDTASAIPLVGPQLVILVGLGGSMEPRHVGLGDVVVSNKVKFFSADKVCDGGEFGGSEGSEYIFGTKEDLEGARRSGKIVVDRRDRILQRSFLRYQRRVVHCESTDDILQDVESNFDCSRLSQIDKGKLPKIFEALPSSERLREIHLGGWILGSDHVVDSAEYRDYLNEKNVELELDIHRQKSEFKRADWVDGKLHAVDMESYGVLRAAKTAIRPARLGGVPHLNGALVVRGISDLAEGKGALDRVMTKEDAVYFRRLAVQNAAEVTFQLIENIDYSTL